MVNFEPCTLAALLLGLLGQLHWEREEDETREQNPAWFTFMVVGYFIALSTAWLGYFFVLAIAIHLVLSGRRRMGGLLIVLALLSGAIFLLQIRLAAPGAWNNLFDAFRLRLGHSTASGEAIPFGRWVARIGRSLVTHILWPSWLLGLGGAVLLVRERRDAGAPGMAWLARVCLIFFAMDAFYVGAFRNASYIHNYSAYYFILPVAICGGIGLDAAATWLDSRVRRAGSVGAVVLCIVLAFTGWRAADRLLGQAYLLETETAEPDDLILQLGHLIQTRFSPDTTVLTNFDYSYTPQLSYYAQRRILNNLTYDIYWQDALKSRRPLGGLIWAGDPDAQEVLAVLNGASLHAVRIDALDFYLWTPGP